MRTRWLRGEWGDGLLAVALLSGTLVIALNWPVAHPLDPVGIGLVACGTLPLTVRRRWPVAVLGIVLAATLPFYALEYSQDALIPACLVALYTVASCTNRTWSLLTGAITTSIMVGERLLVGDHRVKPGALGTLGWIFTAIVLGEAVRSQRAYIAAIVDRAERAERTREEEAQRRVTVERLRIARDLHDLLAHCITSISVQAAVASHLISVGGEQSDLKVLAKALDAITETCGEARDELQATLGVLRDSLETVHPLNARTALPGLSRLAELAEPVRLSGIEVTFQTEGRERSLPPTVDVVAYRIVQEALTNVVKHSGASQTTVALHYLPESLRVTVTDDGRRGAPPAGGYGITGMIERARAVGGSLSARSRVTGGFLVTAELPTGRPEVMGHDDPRPAS